MDTILQFGISNSLIACLLAVVALLVGAYANRPKLTHLLWVLVLVKLVTPPIFNVALPLRGATSLIMDTELVSAGDRQDSFAVIADGSHNENVADVKHLPAEGALFTPDWNTTKQWLGGAWLLGALAVFLVSITRVVQFHLLLRRNAKQAGAKLLAIGERVAGQMGQKSLPTIVTTTANVSPLVWWVGGDPKIVLPQRVVKEMNDEQCQLILAHEMAHVCRRDYLVRWLEWLARVAFWWNPVVWLAHRNLRAAEEICCDQMVLSSLKPNAKSYANTILAIVESLVVPVGRPLAMASEINSGSFLQQRIEMIMTRELNEQPTRRLPAFALYFALLVIPLGFVNAQNADPNHQPDNAAETERKEHDHGHDPVHDGQHKALAELEQSVKKEVESGTMTEAEAAAALQEANQQHREAYKHTERPIDYEMNKKSAALEIQRLVAKGELTEEQGDVKLRKSIEQIEFYQSASQLKAELEPLVEAGELTKHEAEVKVYTRASEIQRAKLRERGSRAKVKIKQSLTAGEITAAQAEMKLAKLEEGLDAQVEAYKRYEVRSREQADIAQQMKAGEITKEQAHERLMDLVGREVDRAIKAGNITAEEAREKLKKVSEVLRQNLER